jgi:cell division protein FtsW (lipid II flippase)
VALSYTTALDREVRGLAVTSRVPTFGHLLLPITSVVALLAIGLAYAGSVQTAGLRWPAGTAAPVNLNTVTGTGPIERVLDARFTNAADRRLAAQGLVTFLVARRERGDTLANVGALAEARIAASEIDANPQATEFSGRLRQLREQHQGSETAAPDSLPLLTSDALAAIKPSLVVRTPSDMARLTATYAGLYVAAFYVVFLTWRVRGLRGDMWLLAGVHLLTAVGFALLLSRADPLRDTLLIIRYTTGIVVGLAVLALVSFVDFRKAAFLRLSCLPLAAALGLSLLLILFGDGPGQSGARVNLGPVQPIEAIRLLLAFFLAGYFAERWELLRQLRSRTIANRHVPAWLHVPRLEYVLPVVIGVGAALLFFVLQKDLGPALYLACVFLAMYAVARARVAMAVAGVGLLAVGFVAGYWLDVSSTLTARVEMWQSPWDNTVRGGDQIAQSIWAVSTGGWSGTGLGFGDTRYLPAGHTDLVLSAIGEELGVIGLVAIAAVYIAIGARGLRIALRAATDYGFFLATAVTLFLAIPVVLMAAGVFGLIPLTGIVTPFLSYGGSAMVANLAAIGVLMAIDGHGSRRHDAEPFRRPTQSLGATLAAAAVVLLIVMTQLATVSADELVVRPHLGVQADGVRRYQYNPRVLDVARTIPRGTVYDRRGLVLATGEADVLGRARTEYAKFGIAIDAACANRLERCYPLGGAGFHVLGNVTSRVNWSAPNSSYVERDADARLRGFDDHATVVTAAGGPAVPTIRRDYRELLPLLRHRYDADHPAVRAVLDRSRDVRLTIDAPLQARVSAILARYASRSTTGRAAAIVIDTDTGQLLAAASYPFPTADTAGLAASDVDATLLDRARYGLYPPGSTFKLVTAAAALEKGLDANNVGYTCAYLPDGRVGARIPGWNRPVRDDVLDTRPHGTLHMHDGLVHSCNAYFAQLAVRVGARSLMETAARAGISTAPDSSVARLRDTLPQAGYGQGDVVASPLRMARIAAALANGGRLRDVSWDAGGKPAAAGERLVRRNAAALLARYMRDSVLSGTGRTLRGHPLRIAGKTGTAEVSGAASHSWFVGFAPFDGAASKIAFAVIVENAGYGSAAAAPLSGEIVTAASELGLIQ